MANFCEYCGRALKPDEVCSCMDGKAAIADKDTVDFGGILKSVAHNVHNIGAMKYTDMVKTQVKFVVTVVTFASFLISLWLGDTFGGDSAIFICIIGTILGYNIAKLMVSKLGMLMEISYNANEIRMMLMQLTEKDKAE